MARPSARTFFANFRTTDASVPRKLRLAARNNARKLRTQSRCCGNPGEPGC